jgi:MFS family permease
VTRAVYRHEVDDEGLAQVLRPRDDLLREVEIAPGRFGCDIGPFRRYERVVTIERDETPGRHVAVDTIDFQLAIPVFGFIFVLPVKHALGQRRETSASPRTKPPWWAPPDRLDRRATTVLGLLCALSIAAGYLGALLSQTIAFVADDFGASDAQQGAALTAARAGVFVSMVVIALADRKGRRTALAFTLQAGALVMATAALAPNLVAFGASQTLARGFVTAAFVLLGILAAEEMPAGSRAFAVSVMAMTAALGAGMVLWFLPIADLDPAAWRALYVVPLVWLMVVRLLVGGLPESGRFQRSEQTELDDLEGHTPEAQRRHRWRLLLLGSSAFLFELFLTPSSQFLVDFLRDDRGFAAWEVSLFQIGTNLPGGIGIVVGGRLADTRGRRVVGSVGLLVGVATTAIMFNVAGWSMWAWSFVGSLVGAAVIPALGVYRPEMFPTHLRGRANSVITFLSVSGAATGLLVVGYLSDRWGSVGPPIALLALGPVVLAALVLLFYPETAHRELEDINPEDEVLRTMALAERDGGPEAGR